MLVIALTGGIGSGKTAVAKIFSSLDVPVIDTDIIARELVEPGNPALQEIVREFGAKVLNEQGELNRSALREIIFADPEKKARLEKILHPRIYQEVWNQLKSLHSPYSIVVIPLLVETGQQKNYDRVLVVDAPEDLRIQRVMERDHMTPEQVRNILQAQASREERLEAASDLISNTGSMDDLVRQVKSLHEFYLEQANQQP